MGPCPTETQGGGRQGRPGHRAYDRLGVSAVLPGAVPDVAPECDRQKCRISSVHFRDASVKTARLNTPSPFNRSSAFQRLQLS